MSTDERYAILAGLIGKPYAPDAEGPEAFDCYGLTRHIQRVLFGRTLPRERVVADRSDWRRVEWPSDGDLVLMGAGGDHHIGTFLAPALVLHALEPLNYRPGDRRAGVMAEPIPALRFRGFSSLRFYAPA